MYSTEQLAKLSKVSIRTLHYYDEIHLLAPLTRMTNGRRLYGKEQLLKLQEILYFKEIGLSLDKIKLILKSKDFDRVSILLLQKKALNQEITRLQKLTESIDKTIKHHKGEEPMSEQQIGKGFENFIKDANEFCEANFDTKKLQETKEKLKQLSKEEHQSYIQDGIRMLNGFLDAIKSGKGPEAKEVQELLKESFDKNIFKASKEEYEKGRQLVIEHPYIYDELDPRLARFIYNGMAIFSRGHFKE